MTADRSPVAPSKGALWTGRVISGLCVLFLAFDGAAKVVQPPPAPVLEACAKLGLPESSLAGIGTVLLVSTIVYAVPSTAVLGAILLTGYLGGAVATHVRVSDPVFPVVFPVLLGALVWLGLFLRDPRLRTLLPLRRGRA